MPKKNVSFASVKHMQIAWHTLQVTYSEVFVASPNGQGGNLRDGEGRYQNSSHASLPAWLHILCAQCHQQMSTLELFSHTGKKIPLAKNTNTNFLGIVDSVLCPFHMRKKVQITILAFLPGKKYTFNFFLAFCSLPSFISRLPHFSVSVFAFLLLNISKRGITWCLHFLCRRG